MAQSHGNWRLLIHDDGSQDDTLALAVDYAFRFPEQIKVLNNGVECGGAKFNFAYLMGRATADYIMFADQDDIWLPGKVKDSLQRLMAEEDVRGKQVPVAVFTDLTVVDETLQVIAPSFWAFQNLKPQQLISGLENLAVRNCVTGCTLLMNRAALVACLPVLPVAVMHDWWCALKILQKQGTLIPLHASTILYRQHSGNVVGARQWSLAVVLQKAFGFFQYRQGFMAKYRMAKHFLPGLTIFSFFMRKVRVVAR